MKKTKQEGETMFLDDETKWKQLAKWIIGIVASCILLFLGVRYISDIAGAVLWFMDLIRPFLIGLILALVLNVPLDFFEKRVLAKHPAPGKEKLRRSLAILLSVVLVFGIFIGVAVLVIPELVNAIVMFATAIIDFMDQMATLESSIDFSRLPFGEYLAQIDINWTELGDKLESWLSQLGSSIVNQAGNAVGSVASSLVDLGIGFVFSIYILANKEKLIRQINRLIPYVGAFIAGLVGALLIFTVKPFKAVIFVIFLVVLQQVEGNVIYPKVVGAKVNLPAMWMLAAITIGGSLAGPLGMLLGVPTMSAFYSLLREATEKRERRMRE